MAGRPVSAADVAAVDDDAAASAAASSGLIAQTDASGQALAKASLGPNNSLLLAAHRQSEQSEMARMKQRQRLAPAAAAAEPADGTPGNGGGGALCYNICSILLAICFCLPSDEDGRYGSHVGAVSGEGAGARAGAGPTLLARQLPHMHGRKCLVLDLDETLVHSSFKPVPNPDYIIPVLLEGTTHRVYVVKRPGVDLFLEKLGALYEIVVFTASLSKYADPLLDMLDVHHVIQGRLFRESCTVYQNNYVKDLQLLGRDIKDVIIVDNSPASYMFQPENAIGVSTFIDDINDRELYYCLPFLEAMLNVQDVTRTLSGYPEFVQRQIASACAVEETG
jgi:RNA polymerase II subunit A small phosphatase-like protein